MINQDIKSINYRLWLVLILTSFIPLVYSTTRIHFLGSIPSSWTFSIAAQVAWLNVGYEVLSEALLIPLAFVLGKAISNQKKFAHRASVALRVTFLSYFCVTVGVLWFAPELIQAMKQQPELYLKTTKYIRLESIAILGGGEESER